ncbi:glutathione S-transferase family protein [Tabrizicola sp.]|uniref:glutathione S-transferase family protein n=1 Tax=Tabrizicola sp. TaxID=2005166 RepID=UPI00286C0082|nr:glutathione S-transferase family protein [Tabrizicola sp.]
MQDLTFYTNPQSRSRITHWMLEEVGEPYETIMVPFGAEMKAPVYRAINPMGKVPALRHKDQIITEGAAIITYLADAFPTAGLMPANRGSFYRWMFFGAGPLEAAVTNKALGVEVPPERRGMVGYGSMDTVLKTLEAHLTSSPYFCGDNFSAADVYVGSQIGWGLRFKTVEDRPVFVDYWSRISARPALARSTALNDALLPKG